MPKTASGRSRALGQATPPGTEQLRVLLDHSSDIVSILDRDGTVFYLSPAVEQLLGYAPTELIGRNAFSLVHPDDASGASSRFEKLVSRPGGRYTDEYRYRHQDGSWRAVESIVTNLLDNEHVRGVVVRTRDITERKLADEALHQSETKYRSLVEQAADGIMIVDDDSNVCFANTRACEMLGYSADEILRINIRDTYLPGELDCAASRMQELREGGHLRFERDMRRKDGGCIPVEVIVRMVRTDFYQAIVRDITDRRLAEEKLVASEQKFRAIFDAANDAIFLMEGDRFVDCNHKTEEVFGCTRAQILYHSPVDFSPSHQPDGSTSAASGEVKIESAFAGHPQFFEWRHVRLDGTPFDVEVSLTRVEIDGRWMLLAVVRDVTERRRVEEALRRSEASLSEAQRVAHVGSWEWNMRTGEIDWSEETCRIFGVDRRTFEATYEAFDRAVHPDDRERVDGAIRDALEGKARYSPDYRIVRSDGTECVVHCEGEVIRSESGDPSRMVGTIQDITERERAEEALRESNERFRQLAENINEVFWMTDAETTKMLYISPAYETVWGRPCQSVYDEPRSYVEAIHPDDRAGMLKSLDHKTRSGTLEAQYRVVHPDGTVRWIRDRGFPIRDQRGEVYRVAGIAEDVTDQKRAAEELKQANVRLRDALEELKAAELRVIQQERLRALGTMASGIAHDVNNALTAILGFSELLLQRPEILSDRPRAVQYLESVHTAAIDAGNTVSRLREFYRHREGADVFAPVDLRQIAEQAISLTRPRWAGEAQASGVTVEVRAELAHIPLVRGNAADLRELLTNLIFNAVDSMPDGGTAAVRTRLDGSCVVLEVADTGAGMTEEVRRRCLEPFFTTKGERGTGLGLAMVYGIVQRHGGHVDIESAVGTGTTVRVHLPVEPTGKRGDATRSGTAATARALRVLVVDDEPQVRNVIGELLRAQGHDVELAGGGHQALELMRRGSFDVVIVDRAMPQMNGDQLAVTLKAMSPSLPVIMLTGFGTMMQAAGETPTGVDAVVSKPVTMNALDTALAEVLGG